MRIKILKEQETWKPDADEEQNSSTMASWMKKDQAGLEGETAADDPDRTVRLPQPFDNVEKPEELSPEEVEDVLNAYAKRNSSPVKHLKMAGFEDVRELGRGQFGVVYGADHPSGREMAVKAVEKGNPGYDREINAYKTIGQARSKSEIIAKHFPLIYTVDTDSHDNYAFIAMERLTDEGAYADLIKDLFSGGEYLIHARGDMMARGVWKDLSRRIKTYFNNDASRDKIIDTIFEGTPDDYIQDIKAWASSWQAWRQIKIPDNFSSEGKRAASRIMGYVNDAESEIELEDVQELNKALQNGYYYDALEIMRKEMEDLSAPRTRRDVILNKFYKLMYPRYFKSGIWMDQMIDEFLLYSDRDAFQDEFGGLKREFEEEPWMVYFITEALRKLKEYRPDEVDPVWQDVSKGKNIQDFYWTRTSGIVNGWVNFIRKQAPIGIHHKPELARIDRGGAPDEVGDTYEEAKSIKKALDELERMTGLAARDMHDKNVMMRPIDGSIVVVDVGMFKPREEIVRNAQRKMNETKSELREQFYQEASTFDFKFDDFTPKTGLHPSFWEKDKLFDNISNTLKLIAKEFAEDLEIDTILDDILLVGSLASYNWHKKSDIDVHLVIDFGKVNKDEDLVEELMRLHRMRWNEDHNIRIYGHEVEIYIQDTEHKGHYAGIYSLKTDEWLKKPQKDDPEIDFAAISNKAATLANEINEIDRLYRKNYVSEAHSEAEALKKKIREMRQVGLDGEGMYSVENLAFKVLRNNGFMRKLSNIRDNSYDIMNSIGESPVIKLKIQQKYNEAWAIKSKNKHGKPAGFGSLAKPVYCVAGREGDAAKAVKQGIELKGWDKYAQLVVEAYEAAPARDPKAEQAFEKLGHHILKNIKKVQSSYPVEFVDGQPYDSAEQMSAEIKETGIMKISKDFNQSEVFGEIENLFFRAVHDYYGHLAARGHESDDKKITTFDLEGELRAYNGHLKMLGTSDMAKAVFTEVIGQACYNIYYGNFPEQKVCFLDGFDHVNLGNVKGYQIVDQDLVPVSQEGKKRKKKKKKKRSKTTYSRNPRSKGGYKGKTHWGVGGWWYNGTSGASGGDAGGDGGGGE